MINSVITICMSCMFNWGDFESFYRSSRSHVNQQRIALEVWLHGFAIAITWSWVTELVTGPVLLSIRV